MVHTYSVKADGDKLLTRNFRVREFACKDGTDTVLIDDDLVLLLQQLRDHFGKSVTINSGYRTPEHNAKVGGAKTSLHLKGMAADIVVSGEAPLTVAQYAEHLMPDRGGIGLYIGRVHVDTRTSRGRWDNRSGKEVGVKGWPGYTPKTWYQDHAEWAKAAGITAKADRPDDPVTRAEVWAMLHQLDNQIVKGDM